METTGLDWRQERLATCQLFAEGIGVVVLKTGGGSPERLAELLEDEAVEKVFHHAPFDLRFLVHGWDVRPASIRCTKVASKLLAPGAPNETHSLQHLVACNLGVSLDDCCAFLPARVLLEAGGYPDVFAY